MTSSIYKNNRSAEIFIKKIQKNNDSDHQCSYFPIVNWKRSSYKHNILQNTTEYKNHIFVQSCSDLKYILKSG